MQIHMWAYHILLQKKNTDCCCFVVCGVHWVTRQDEDGIKVTHGDKSRTFFCLFTSHGTTCYLVTHHPYEGCIMTTDLSPLQPSERHHWGSTKHGGKLYVKSDVNFVSIHLVPYRGSPAFCSWCFSQLTLVIRHTPVQSFCQGLVNL